MKMTKKILSLVLLAVMLVSALSLSVSAEGKDSCFEWMLSRDESTLVRSDGKTYEYYSMDNDVFLDPSYIYSFENEVKLGDIYGYSPDSEIVWIEDDDEYYVYFYATQRGREMLYAFEKGDYSEYRLEDIESAKSAAVTERFIMALEDATKGVVDGINVDVSSLATYPAFELYAYDTTDTLCTAIGRMFVIDENYYYLHYASLDNSHFDANGNLSYRQGNVTLVKLSGELKATVSGAMANMSIRYPSYEYEVDSSGYESAFWTFFIIAGFVIPMVLFIMGFALANSRKRGCPKYWYALSILAAVWILISIIITALLV